MMSADPEDHSPVDRRIRERRLAQLEAARKKRWTGTTAEHRRAFAKKLSDAAKASRAGAGPDPSVKMIQVPRFMITVAAYDRICRNALKSRWSVKAILRHLVEMHS